MSRGPRIAVVLGLAAAGLLGCLRAFGPDLRARGVHASARPGDGAEICMSCHESEAEALARMKRQGGREAPADAPLVADWMLADERACTSCHSVRPSRAGFGAGHGSSRAP